MKFKLELHNRVIRDSRLTFTESRALTSTVIPSTYEEAEKEFLRVYTKDSTRWLTWSPAALKYNIESRYQKLLNSKYRYHDLLIWGDFDTCVAALFENQEVFKEYLEFVHANPKRREVIYNIVRLQFFVELDTAEELYQFMNENGLGLGREDSSLTDDPDD